jgi:hypothetical protein
MINQTAIKWLEYQFLSPATLYGHDFIMDKLKQAKQMEKEQIEKAFHDSMVDIVLGKMSSPEEYYNETYGKEN